MNFLNSNLKLLFMKFQHEFDKVYYRFAKSRNEFVKCNLQFKKNESKEKSVILRKWYKVEVLENK